MFVAGLRSPHGLGVLAWTDEDRLAGGMSAHHYPTCRVLLLNYLAVDPTVRGKGIGSTLVRHAQQVWFPALSPLLLLGEVEDPRKHEDIGFGAPWPRFRLYGRFGARVLDLPYLQPALRPGCDRVRDLVLMAFATTPSAYSGPDRVDGGPIGCCLREYFASCEQDRAGGRPDTELATLLAACDNPSGVALLAVGDLPAR